jgi:hypothetical protein
VVSKIIVILALVAFAYLLWEFMKGSQWGGKDED